jgi:hypothetical protein
MSANRWLDEFRSLGVSLPDANRANLANRENEVFPFGTFGTFGTPKRKVLNAPQAGKEEGQKAVLVPTETSRPTRDLDPFSDLPPNYPGYKAEWRRWHSLLIKHYRDLHHDEPEAATLAYGRLINLWHNRYGQRPDPHRCAGCDGPIGTTNIFALPDGARVHDDAGLSCLTAYGSRWRTAAANALSGLGIDPSEGHPVCRRRVAGRLTRPSTTSPVQSNATVDGRGNLDRACPCLSAER